MRVSAGRHGSFLGLMDRRQFLVAAAAGPLIVARPALGAAQDQITRLKARVRPPQTLQPGGMHPLGLASGRDGILFIPSSVPADQPKPLLVMLHHAGSSGQRWFGPLRERAEALGVVVVAPDARGRTWELDRQRVVRDFAFIDGAVSHALSRARVDATRIGIGGFGDGASYALTLGIPNGDLFTHVLAFSPSFYAETDRRGDPLVFLAHGASDTVFPVIGTSRGLVEVLRDQKRRVEYLEFEGGHELPPEVLDRGLAYLVGQASPPTAPSPAPSTRS